MPAPVIRQAPPRETYDRLIAWITSSNILFEEGFEQEQLGTIGNRVVEDWRIDEQSRGEWMENQRKAMDLAMQVVQQKNYPWPNASSVIYPLITVASVQFAARAYPAIINGRNVVKGIVAGPDDGVKMPPMPGPAGGPPSPAGIPMPPPAGAAPVAAAAMGSTALSPVGPGPVPPAPMAGAPGPGMPPEAWIVPPGARQKLADLIGEHMSWQLLDEQEEWEPEMDMMLHVLPIVGCEFKKTYFDPEKQRNASVRVAAQHVVINYRAKSLDRAPRITEEVEFYPLEVEEFINSGLWPDLEGISRNNDQDLDAPIKFLEQHRWLDLDGDGMREPYIVTVHEQTAQVVRIMARYDEEGVIWNESRGRIQKINAVQYYTKFDFIPNPDGGIYGVGFGQLLRPMNESINTTLNMLIDAGHLANTQGGFIGKGLNMSSGSMRFQPGEYKLVNAPGGAVREAIVQLQFPGPSPVLFQLLGMLVESGKEIASVKDVLTGEQQQQNVPATTTLALIEQGLKVFSAIYKRVYRALKSEFDKLYRLNRLYLDKDAKFKAGGAWRSVSQADYEEADGVEPYSDPTMITNMQKLGRAQFLMQFMTHPLCNPKEILTRIFEAAELSDIGKLFADQPPPNPAILAKLAELKNKATEIDAASGLKKAQSLRELATAINQLAMADKAAGDKHVAWLDQQLDIIKAQMEADGFVPGAQGPGQGAPPAPAPGGPPMPAPSPPSAPVAPSQM